MGVMQCDRKGCNNILCYRYSKKYGYICNDCFQELSTNIISITEFMNKEKDPYSDSREKAWINMLNAEFPKG
jgi:hypothetical protein